MKNLSVKEIVTGALGIALVFLATYLIKVPNGIQGYFNLGDGFILLFASILNPFLAFLVGGVGSALADAAGGYAIYFIPTLFIKGIEAIVVSYLISKLGQKSRYIIYLIGGAIMVCGYFVADAFINESWALSATGIPSNVIQALAGYVIALVCLPIISKQVLPEKRKQEVHCK